MIAAMTDPSFTLAERERALKERELTETLELRKREMELSAQRATVTPGGSPSAQRRLVLH